MEVCTNLPGPGGGYRCFNIPSATGGHSGGLLEPRLNETAWYSLLISDASVVASIKDLAGQVSDENARKALYDGVTAAVAAMQQRAGEGIRIKE